MSYVFVQEYRTELLPLIVRTVYVFLKILLSPIFNIPCLNYSINNAKYNLRDLNYKKRRTNEMYREGNVGVDTWEVRLSI